MKITKHGSHRSVVRAAATTFALALMLLAAGCEDLITPMVKEDVRLAGLPERTLTILTPSNGSSTPLGVIKVKDGEPVDLVATPNSTFFFAYWDVSSGASNVTFNDVYSSSTKVRVSGGNAIIVATFTDTLSPIGIISIPGTVTIGSTFYKATKTIAVNLTYFDNVAVTAMKLSETSFATGTPSGWIAPNSTTNYTFATDGAKTLYVRFKDGDGNESDIYSTQVTIDSTGPVPTVYRVDQIDPFYPDPLYVTNSTTNLQLSYAAGDGATGSGVAKVYFTRSNASPAAGTAQIDPYPAVPTPFAWKLDPVYDIRGYYTIYFWFEDKLGNRSGPFLETVRYDDKWEGYGGNNTVAAVSGATIIIGASGGPYYGDTKSLSNIYNPSYGVAYLNDVDIYKWGFYEHDPSGTYQTTITIWMNDIITSSADFPLVSFYTEDDTVTPNEPVYDIDAHTVTYTFDSLPYYDTGGYEYYFYMQVQRATAAPYKTFPYAPPNYNVTWTFNEEIM